MTKIPADILAAAKAAAYATEADGNDEAAITSLVGVNVIAAAIHAERERCANVARAYFDGDEYGSNYKAAGYMVSVAILAGEEQ